MGGVSTICRGLLDMCKIGFSLFLNDNNIIIVMRMIYNNITHNIIINYKISNI